jgi:hypothetical protein
MLEQEQAGVGAIVDVQKFSSRRPASPDRDLVRTAA